MVFWAVLLCTERTRRFGETTSNIRVEEEAKQETIKRRQDEVAYSLTLKMELICVAFLSYTIL
jgi:hypothetical protein